MMSHLLAQHKSLVNSRNRRLCWQRTSQNTCFFSEIDMTIKWQCLLHDSGERCVSMFSFQYIHLYHPAVPPRTFYNHIRRLSFFLRFNFVSSLCWYHFPFFPWLLVGTCNHLAWWRHQMEIFSALLALCAGNLPVPGEFPPQRPVTWSFDVFFDLRLE